MQDGGGGVTEHPGEASRVRDNVSVSQYSNVELLTPLPPSATLLACVCSIDISIIARLLWISQNFALEQINNPVIQYFMWW